MREGTDIDRFRVEATIGIGGMATVYRVQHRHLHTHHALKLLKVSNPALAARLLQEGRIQAGLKHPNVVAVADVVEHEGAIGLLMELVEGSSLEECLREGPMLYDEALDIFRQILAGMGAAHAAGVTHRDLKPANILLANEDGRLVAKVTDFGIAKVLRSEQEKGDTRTGMGMGTPGYMAPEQVTDAASVDLRADIFALGAIFYEMLSGRRAIKGTDQLDTLNRTVKGVYAPLSRVVPGIPSVVDAVVRRALSVRREDRFPDCASMAEALNAAPRSYVPTRPGGDGSGLPGRRGGRDGRSSLETPSDGATPPVNERPLLNLNRLAERRNAREQLETAVVDEGEPVVPPPSVIAQAWNKSRAAELAGGEPVSPPEGNRLSRIGGDRAREGPTGAFDATRVEPPAANSAAQPTLDLPGEVAGPKPSAVWWMVKALRPAVAPMLVLLLIAWAFASRTGAELKEVNLEREAQVLSLSRAADDSLSLVPTLVSSGANVALLRSQQQKYAATSSPLEKAQAAQELATVLLQELDKLPPTLVPEELESRRQLKISILVLEREAARYAELAREQDRLSDSVAGRIARWMRLTR